MEFNEVVKKRKSKRWYLDKEVPKELIIKMITEGYADVDHPNNQYQSPREDLQEWTTWHE